MTPYCPHNINSLADLNCYYRRSIINSLGTLMSAKWFQGEGGSPTLSWIQIKEISLSCGFSGVRNSDSDMPQA